MKGIWKKKRKYNRLWKSLQERARLNTILWDFQEKNYSRGSGDILHFPKIKVSSCQNHPTRPETGKKWKTDQNRTLPKNEFFGGKWREYGRNKRNHDRFGKSLQEKARLNTIPLDFPRGEIILGVLEIPCTHQKSKWAAASWKKTINTECFPFHTHSHRVFFGRTWRECERNVGKYVGKSQWWRWWLNIILRESPKFFFKSFLFNHLKFIWNYFNT